MAAEQVIEQVADHVEDVAEATRNINPQVIRYFLGGVGVGAVIGFVIGYRFNSAKIKAEAFKESEAEIESIREHYQNKVKAQENDDTKKEMREVIVEEHYVTEVDEVPDPPTTQSLRVTETLADLQNRPLPAPVPVDPAKPVIRSVEAEKDKMAGWNFAKEMASRTSDKAHIIHQDEFYNNESGNAQVSYTYYAGDDVLVDEDRDVMTDRDEIVGRNTLSRFGHGTDDFNVLYVRNPVLELDMEISRHTGSYEEEVLGLSREPHASS